ncbi:MAG: hypothetical protein AAF585_18160 [Verrucomicrobiota bacterium]
MERSQKKKWRLLTVILIVGLIGIVTTAFKFEEFEEVCALTGSTQRYNTYFSIYSTRPVIKTYWIENVLRSNNQNVPELEWVRTMGTTRTIFTVSFAHSRAPLTYDAIYWSLEILRESHTDLEILALAQAFASGDPERQKQAADQIR